MNDDIYQLTVSHSKADVFCKDFPMATYLRKIASMLGIQVDALHNVSMLLLKPECQYGFSPSNWVQLVNEAGFRHTKGIRFQWSPNLANAIWRYEPLVAGDQASDYVELWANGPGYAAIFTRSKVDSDPETVAMTHLKGRSTPTLQRSGTIRKIIEQDLLLLTYIHTCDEPLDMVRELGLILDQDICIFPSSQCWPEQAFGAPTFSGPILNTTAYHQLVQTIASQSLVGVDTTRRLQIRELFDWRTHFTNPSSLGALEQCEKLLIAAANTRSSLTYSRRFPGVRQLYRHKLDRGITTVDSLSHNSGVDSF